MFAKKVIALTLDTAGTGDAAGVGRGQTGWGMAYRQSPPATAVGINLLH